MENIFNINKNSITSIVGAGGKTSLMFKLAKDFKSKNKVLVTTTTKIYKPQKNQYDFIEFGNENFYKIKDLKEKGIYVYGLKLNELNKIIGVDPIECSTFINYFDYIFVESDGSKEKPLKGFESFEPVVCNKSEKTIGIFDIKTIGMIIKEKNIHRIDKFLELTKAKIKEKMTVDYASKLILNKNDGLFKNAKGEKILYINKVENNEDRLHVNRLRNALLKNDLKYIDSIICGSIKNNCFEKIY